MIPTLGSVPYLNARPLVWGLEERVIFDVPSSLSDRFAGGEFDAALIPLFEVLRIPGCRIVDGLGIGCLGEVFSVLLAHRSPVADLREIVLDPASRTSAHLLRILVWEVFHAAPAFVSRSEDSDAARLIIGDPAMDFQYAPPPGWNILDLGQCWHKWTGLPFVFAVWAVRPGHPDATALADLLRKTAASGLAARPDIAAREENPERAMDYLIRNIQFALGPLEKQAISRFADLCEARGFLAPGTPRPAYIPNDQEPDC